MSSKYQRYNDEEYIYPHKHCPVCKKMIDEDQDFCSAECEGTINKKEKKNKRQMIMTIAMSIVPIVILVLMITVFNV